MKWVAFSTTGRGLKENKIQTWHVIGEGIFFSFAPAAVNLLHCQNSHLWLCCCTVILSDKRHKEELSGVVHLPISISERCEGLQPSSVNNLKSSLKWRDWQWQEEDRRNRDWRDALMRWKEQKPKRVWSDLTYFRPFFCKSSINLRSVATPQCWNSVGLEGFISCQGLPQINSKS